MRTGLSAAQLQCCGIPQSAWTTLFREISEVRPTPSFLVKNSGCQGGVGLGGGGNTHEQVPAMHDALDPVSGQDWDWLAPGPYDVQQSASEEQPVDPVVRQHVPGSLVHPKRPASEPVEQHVPYGCPLGMPHTAPRPGHLHEQVPAMHDALDPVSGQDWDWLAPGPYDVQQSASEEQPVDPVVRQHVPGSLVHPKRPASEPVEQHVPYGCWLDMPHTAPRPGPPHGLGGGLGLGGGRGGEGGGGKGRNGLGGSGGLGLGGGGLGLGLGGGLEGRGGDSGRSAHVLTNQNHFIFSQSPEQQSRALTEQNLPTGLQKVAFGAVPGLLADT